MTIRFGTSSSSSCLCSVRAVPVLHSRVCCCMKRINLCWFWMIWRQRCCNNDIKQTKRKYFYFFSGLSVVYGSAVAQHKQNVAGLFVCQLFWDNAARTTMNANPIYLFINYAQGDYKINKSASHARKHTRFVYLLRVILQWWFIIW